MDNKNTFIIYRSFFETLQKYQQAGKDAEGFDLFMKVANYQLNGVLPDENDSVWFQGFNDIIVPIDKAQERYAQARENGKKGGRPQKVSMFDVKELLDQGRTKAEIAKTEFSILLWKSLYTTIFKLLYILFLQLNNKK